MYKIRILIFCIGLMLTACASFEAEDKEFTSFVINLIENPENYEKIIMNSKYVQIGYTINNLCDTNFIRKELYSCMIHGYKILPIQKVFFIDSEKKSEVNGIYITVISKNITLRFQFLEKSKWVLGGFGKIACGEIDNEQSDFIIE